MAWSCAADHAACFSHWHYLLAYLLTLLNYETVLWIGVDGLVAWLVVNILALFASLSALTAIFFRWTRVSWYQNDCILDFIVAEGDRDGGNNWSYKTCKAPVTINKPSLFYRPVALPAAQPKVSEYWRERFFV